jgi:hypothetical protein
VSKTRAERKRSRREADAKAIAETKRHLEHTIQHLARFACWIYCGTQDSMVRTGCKQVLQAVGITDTIEDLCVRIGLKPTATSLAVIQGGKVIG